MAEQLLPQGLQLPKKQLRMLQSAPEFRAALDSAVIPEPVPFVDTTGTEQVTTAFESQQEAQLTKQVGVHEQSTVDEWIDAASLTGTAHVVRAGFNWFERTEDDDPNFRLSADEVTQILNDYNITGTDNVLKNIHKARSMEHVQQIARDAATADEVNYRLQNAGVKSFLVHALDPIENTLMLGAAAVTGGYGGGAVAVARFAKAAGASINASRRVGQFTHGTAQGAASLGALSIHEAAGTEVTLTDYILSVGLGTAIGGYTMPTRRIDEALGYVKVAPTGRVEIVPPKQADEAAEASKTAETAPLREASAAKTADAPSSWSMPELIRKTRAAVQDTAAALVAPLKRLEAGMQGLSKAGLKRRVQDLTETNLATTIREVLTAATTETAINKSVKARLAELEQQAVADGLSVPEYINNVIDNLKQGLDISPESSATLNAILGTTGDDLGAILRASDEVGNFKMAQQADEITSTPTVQTTAEAPLADTQAASNAAPASTAPDVRTRGSEVDALVAETPNTIFNAPVRALKAVSRNVREFLSEYEKLTAGREALRNFLSHVIDDPLSRYPGRRTAAAQLRVNQNLANTERLEYETAISDYTLKSLGMSWKRSMFGYSTEYLERKLLIEREMTEVMAQRDMLKQKGFTDAQIESSMAGVSDDILSLVHNIEKQYAKSAERAKLQGLNGFENELSSAGYWHRKWTYPAMKGLDDVHGKGTATGLISRAIQQAQPDMPLIEANAIAKAVYDRAAEYSTGARSDYMGQLGKVESENIIELLKAGGTDEVIIESVRRRLLQQVEEAGTTTFAKARIPMDMTYKLTLPDGTETSLLDLVDTNLSGNLEAYQSSMAGRSALASVGIGGGVHGVTTFVSHYRTMIDSHGIPKQQADIMTNQLNSLMADFTGIKPDSDRLHPMFSSLKDLAAATLLSGSGLWQVGETGLILSRKGGYNSLKYMVKNFPGIKGLLAAVGNSSKLHDEFEFVTGMSFQNDVRMQPFTRQLEIQMGEMTPFQKYTSSAREFSSTLNGMRWVHGMQARMLTNLNMHDLWKAGMGDARALKDAKLNGASDELLEAVQRVSITKGDALKGAGLEGLTHAELQEYMQVMARMQDSALLHMRTGWGSGYARSATGQILGQFTSYVAMSHNRVLRGTYHNEGALGVAAVLAYSLPFTAMASYIQEARKGNVLDLDNDEDLQELLISAFKYAPMAGYLGDITSVVSGNYSTRGVASLGVYSMPGNVYSAIGDMATGDPSSAAAGVLKAGSAMSILGAIPGTRALVEALEGSYD